MQLKDIKLTEIDLTENSRPDNFDCASLMESIKASGLIQPIVVAKNFNKFSKKPYVLVAGNRRLRATKKLGDKSIASVVNDTVKNTADLLIFNMTENMQRVDVSGFEQGRLISLLIKKYKLTKGECAARLGVSRIKVNQILETFNSLPPEITKQIVLKSSNTRGKIGLSSAKDIASLRKSNFINNAQAKELASGVIEGKYTTSHLGSISKELKSGAPFDHVKRGIKKISYVQLRVPLYISEREDIEGDITCFIEQLMYGESSDHFTRPRFK